MRGLSARIGGVNTSNESMMEHSSHDGLPHLEGLILALLWESDERTDELMRILSTAEFAIPLQERPTEAEVAAALAGLEREGLVETYESGLDSQMDSPAGERMDLWWRLNDGGRHIASRVRARFLEAARQTLPDTDPPAAD